MSTASVPMQCQAPHMPAASHARVHRRQLERCSTTQHTHLGLWLRILPNERTVMGVCDLEAGPICLHKLAIRRPILLKVAGVRPASLDAGRTRRLDAGVRRASLNTGKASASMHFALAILTLIPAHTSPRIHAQMSATWCSMKVPRDKHCQGPLPHFPVETCHTQACWRAPAQALTHTTSFCQTSVTAANSHACSCFAAACVACCTYALSHLRRSHLFPLAQVWMPSPCFLPSR
jgi:hypothetical protein